jgi:acyl carrier protein
MAAVFDRVRAILVDLVGVNESDIHPTTTFKELDLDSLDMVEFVMRIEDEFAGEYERGGKRFEITDEEAKKIVAVSDAVDYIKSAGIEDQP